MRQMNHSQLRSHSLRKMLFGLLSALICLPFSLSPANASGGYSGGGGGFSGGARSSDRTDSVYEKGKAIYQGRARARRGLKVCLSDPLPAGIESDEASEPAVLKLSSRSLRPYRGLEVETLTTRLVNCEDPATPVATLLPRDDFSAFVYYLNKRFRLRLDG